MFLLKCLFLLEILKSSFRSKTKIKALLPSSLNMFTVSPTLFKHSADHLQAEGRGTFLPERSKPLPILKQTIFKPSFCMHSYLANVYTPMRKNCPPVNTEIYGHASGINHQTTSSSPKLVTQIFLWDEINGAASWDSSRRMEKLSLCAFGSWPYLPPP